MNAADSISARLPDSASLSVKQVAAAFDCSRANVSAWIAAGLLPAVDIGTGTARRAWRISREDAVAFAKKRCNV